MLCVQLPPGSGDAPTASAGKLVLVFGDWVLDLSRNQYFSVQPVKAIYTIAIDPDGSPAISDDPNLPAAIELDGVLRRVGSLPHPAVPDYAELDLRIGWHPSARWELSLVGQNLLHAHHPEFQLSSPTREEYQRGAYVRLVWHY